MDDRGWSPYYVLVCDDIRQEINGKQILIGVYNETMVLPHVPAPINSISFRVAVRLHRADFSECEIKVTAPSGAVIVQNGGPVLAQSTEEYVTFAFQVGFLIIHEIGEYTIDFALDGDFQKIGRLLMRLPDTDEERRKLNA